LERRTQEGAFQTAAIEIVIAARGARVRRKPYRLVGFGVIDELQSQHASYADFPAVMRIGFVNNAEAVALAQIAYEVDLASKDVGNLHGDGVGDVGLVGRSKQRAGDLAFRNPYLRLGGLAVFGGGKAALAVGRYFQPARYILAVLIGAGRMVVAQPDKIAVLVHRRLNAATGVQLINGSSVFALHQEGLQAALLNAQALQ